MFDMNRKSLRFLPYLFILILVSCASKPKNVEREVEAIPQLQTETSVPQAETVENELPEAEPEKMPEPDLSPVVENKAVDEPFDPTSISREVFDSTKSDVQALIGQLNDIIRAKDYDTWVGYLGMDYRAALSDTAFLERISSSSVLKKQQIVLKDLQDYFIHVVVPSRAKDRVDDIEFIGQNRVKAFTLNKKGQPLRLYDLEKTERGWKIVN
ncbi:hypothetical protein MASR2M78_00420 [Treponema sp.]